MDNNLTQSNSSQPNPTPNPVPNNAPTSQPTQNIQEAHQKHAEFLNTINSNKGYINPNNYQELLGKDAVKPKDQPVAPNQIELSSVEQLKGAAPQMPLKEFYQPTASAHNTAIPPQIPTQPNQPEAVNPPNANQYYQQKDQYEILRLVLYIVPFLAIFGLFFKSALDRSILWHAKQSIVTQGIWFGLLILLRLIDLPVITPIGSVFLNIGAYGMLILAGVYAYNGEKYRLPVVYDMAKGFIDEE